MPISSKDIFALADSIEAGNVNDDQNTSILGDVGTGLKRSALNIPSVLTDIGDIIPGALFNATPFDTVTNYIGEATGLQPGRFAEEAKAEFSPAKQAADARVAEAKGFLNKAAALVANPRALLGEVVEAVPTMLAGGAIGRGLQLAGAVTKGTTAIGIGEGAVSAGTQFGSLTDQNVDPRTAALAAAATGAIVGAIGIGGATLAQKMKIADPDLVVAGLAGASRKVAGPPAPRIAALAPPAPPAPQVSKLAKVGEVAARVGKGAIQEGIVEEAPQSAFETMIANIAMGKDLLDGVGESVASGLLAGSVLGGAFNLRSTQPRGDELGTVGPQQTVEEVKQAAEAAGIDINSFDGLVALQKLLRESGDPAGNAAAAKKRVVTSFTEFVAELADTSGTGVGEQTAAKIVAAISAGEGTSKEGIDAALKGRDKKAQARIRSTEYYRNLPDTAAEAATKAAEPKAAVDEPVDPDALGPDLPETAQPQTALSPEEEKLKAATLKAANVQPVAEADAGIRATKDPEKFTKEELSESADEASGLTKRGLRGLASLINGFTMQEKDKADVLAYKKADKGIPARLKALKRAMPKYYTVKGLVRKDTPAELKAFLNKLPKIGENYGEDNRVMAGVRKQGANLADKYKLGKKFVTNINRLTHGYELRTRAKAVTPLARESRLNLRRIGIEYDQKKSESLNTRFARLHTLIEAFDKKSAAVGSDPKAGVTTDLRNRKTALKQGEGFTDAQAAEAAAAKAFILGRDNNPDSANLFALQQAIATEFAGLEAEIGRKNLKNAMGFSKRQVVKTRKQLPGMRPGQADTSTGIRFNDEYNNFRQNNGTIELRPKTNPVRLTTEEQRRRENSYTDTAGNKIPYAPVRIAADGTITRPEGQPESRMEEKLKAPRKRRAKSGKQAPILLLLDTLSFSSMSPVARALAKRFTAIMTKSNYIDNIELILHPEKTGPDGEAALFTPARGDTEGNITQQATLQLWTDGTRETTILHETLHAITVGIVSQWKNDPNVPQARTLEALEALRKDVVTTLRGQKNNTRKPLGGDLDTLLEILEDPTKGLDEFITYSMTNNNLQDWMKTHPAVDASIPAKLKRNWWQVFTAKLQTLLGVTGIKNQNFINALDAYVQNTSTLLGDIRHSAEPSTDTGEARLQVFFFEPTATPDIEELSALVEDIASNVSKNVATRLRAMATSTAVNSKRGMDKAMKGMPIKKVQEKIRATSQYQNAPDTKAADTGTRAAVVDLATMNPDKPWPGKVSPEAVEKATKDEGEKNALHRATISSATQQVFDEDPAIIAAKVRAEKVVAAKEAASEKTAVRPSQRKRVGPNNATPIDRVGRSVMNGVLGFVSGGKYKDYESFANDMLAKYGGKIEEYSAGDRWMQRSLGTFLSKTVDNFGTPAAYRNPMASFEGGFRGENNDAYTSYLNLLSLTPEQMQALLDFGLGGSVDAMKATIPDAAQQDTILRTDKALTELLDRAKIEGYVAQEDMHKTWGEFINLAEGSFRMVSSVSYSQVKPPSDENNRTIFAGDGDNKVSYVGKDRTIGKDGVPISRAIGKQFYMGRDMEGNFYAFEEGTDSTVWDDYGATRMSGPGADPHAFRVSNPTRQGDSFTFDRKVTVAERNRAAAEELGESRFKNSPRAKAHVISGLTRLVQEWSRNIQGREIIAGMLDTNEGLEESAKWITKGTKQKNGKYKLEGVAGTRIIRVTGSGDVQKSRSLQAKLRVPGNWAQIDDNPANRKKFGDMAGHYVAGPVYTSMLDYYDTTPLVNLAAFRTSLTMWKRGKTVLSPVAHVNNITGNVMLAYMYDLPRENLKRSFKLIVWSLASENFQKKRPLSAADRALLEEMKTQGFTLAEAKAADFDVAAEAAFADWFEGKVSTQSAGLVSVFNMIERISSTASDIYSNQDNIFRLATYMTHIQDNSVIGPDGTVTGLNGESGAEVKAAATLQAERAYVDYRIHAPWIKNARESVLPFIAWPYRMFPLLMKVLITKPWKAANVMGAIYGLNALAYSILGADGDDEEQERNLMPEWYQQGIAWMPWVPSNIRLPFGSGENAYFWDITRAVTLADMDQINGSGVPSMLSPGGPAAILMYAIAGFDPFTGKALSSGTDDLAGFLEARGEYLFRGLAPGFATSIRTAIKHQGETGPLGYDYSFWVDAAKVLGISSFQMNKPEAAFYKDITRKQAQRAFNAEIGRVWRDELRQKSPDYSSAANAEVELQRRLTLRLQELAGG